MKNFNYIHEKLRDFIKKYYVNEILKGSIMFLSFGLLYLIFTLIVEYFLWLEPLARTILFWCFVTIESALLFRFILLPIFKLIGISKGISEHEASRLIGKHFKEVDDKLLNILQLKDNNIHTELLEASIEQKSKNIQLITFKKAIVFKNTMVHLKYLFVPLLIWIIIWLTGNNTLFTQSLNRIVHHQTVFIPPAPFYFEILNKELETIEDKTFVLKFRTTGEVVPENVRIIYDQQSYFINYKEEIVMEYSFEFPNRDIQFYLEGNDIRSQSFTLKVISAPKITDFSMELHFPDYIKRVPESIKNTGNAVIPFGTTVKWLVASENTESIDFIISENESKRKPGSGSNNMNPVGDGNFSISKKINRDMTYQIQSSNRNLKNHEKLTYKLEVIHDEYPKIFVSSDIDSVNRGPVHFLGQLTDDYGLSRLQVIARNTEDGSQSIGKIDINKSDFEEFFYVFPTGILLEEGKTYEVYFEIFDNDAIKGPKKTVSKSFLYRNKTEKEQEQEILKEQKQGIEDIENSKQSKEEMEESLDAFSRKLKNKEKVDWNDRKQLDEFLERQKRYQEMMDKNAEKMMENLDEMNDENESTLDEKKIELMKRWEEMKKYKEKEDLIKELEKLAEKLKKEDLLESVDKLKEQSKQEQRSLERILELTKQFYVEKKSVQIMRKLEELAEEQADLSNDKNNSREEQEKLNSKFDSIQKDFKDLREQNNELKSPLDIFESKADEKLIEMDMNDASKSLKENENNNIDEQEKSKRAAKEKQQNAAKRMKELSEKMESGLMEMEMQGAEENIQDLQQVLKNLLKFSHDQERLMLSFKDINASNAEYPQKLKEQIKLKAHFEHIDDSLYALSLRMVKLSSRIQEDLSMAHYNLDKSLENIKENRIDQGMSNQQYTMTAANNLADLLSDMLQSLQNKQPGSGKGKGKEGELSLPDIIKKQQGMMKKMKEGMNPQKGEGEKGKEEMSGEQFQMYQEQKLLKEQMKDFMAKEGIGGKQEKAILDQMENLERILLEKGISNEAIARMQKLEHDLLELENASLERNRDSKRKSETNKLLDHERSIDELDLNSFRFNENELLRRERLDMSPDYLQRVKKYFESTKIEVND